MLSAKLPLLLISNLPATGCTNHLMTCVKSSPSLFSCRTCFINRTVKSHILPHHLKLKSNKCGVDALSLVACLQSYILVLWGCEVGLLGLGYLVLLIGVFTYPPIRGRWNQTEEGGVELDENHQSSSSGEPDFFFRSASAVQSSQLIKTRLNEQVLSFRMALLEYPMQANSMLCP